MHTTLGIITSWQSSLTSQATISVYDMAFNAANTVRKHLYCILYKSIHIHMNITHGNAKMYCKLMRKILNNNLQIQFDEQNNKMWQDEWMGVNGVY